MSISLDVVVILLLFSRMPSILRPGFVVALIALTFSVMRSMASKANIPASIGIITKSEALRTIVYEYVVIGIRQSLITEHELEYIVTVGG